MKAILRPSLSTALVAFFLSLLLFLAIFAEVFDSGTTEVDMAQVYANPIPVDELLHLKTMTLENKNGHFVLDNSHPQGNLEGPWHIPGPEPLKVKSDIIIKIIESLSTLRVRNFHKLEAINITSFSLDNPTMTLKLHSTRDKKFEIKIGLINPIDNSAYLSLSTQNQIFQIEPLGLQLESFDLNFLTDVKVLTLNRESLASLEVHQSQGLIIRIVKKDTGWIDQNGTGLNSNKVKDLFNGLETLKHSTNLENLTPEQISLLTKLTSTSYLRLKLGFPQGPKNYFISEINEKIPGLEIPLQASYILSTEDKKTFVLLDKIQIKAFETGLKEFK